MKKGGTKGGSTTTGRNFEDRLQLGRTLVAAGYELRPLSKNIQEVVIDSQVAGYLTKYRGFYEWLDFIGIRWEKRPWEFRPDVVFVNSRTRTVHVLELKTQSTAGSVDEKLFSVAYRVRYFRDYFEGTPWKAEFAYVLAGTEYIERREGKYRDLYRYILESDASYVFEKDFALTLLGL